MGDAKERKNENAGGMTLVNMHGDGMMWCSTRDAFCRGCGLQFFGVTEEGRKEGVEMDCKAGER